MAPLLISGVASIANNVLENWNRASEARAAAKAKPQIEFDSLMKTARGAVAVKPSQMTDASVELMRQVLQAPEVSAVLNGQNLPSGSQLEFSADGSLSLRLADGRALPFNLTPQTQALAAQLRASLATLRA